MAVVAAATAGRSAAAPPVVPFSATAAVAAPSRDSFRFIGVDELKPGMKGYGLSVFHGTTIDTFGVEIVAVRRNNTPQGDMILARGSGAGLERSGTVAGMSGSPIYIEGRLAGAMAYGWTYMTEPIMGITPIGEMLCLQAPPGEAPEGGGGGAPPPEARAAWRALLATRGPEASALLERRGESTRTPDGARPIGALLSISGFDAGAAAGVARWLEPLGAAAISAAGVSAAGDGASGGASPGPEDLVPGAAVGVQLVRGDASISAIGTLTWRDGDRIMAFGHPMLQRGRSAFPMTTATIQTVMPRLSDSFKMGSAGRLVGTVDLDLQTGIGGRIGPVPAMIPVTVRVEDAALAGRRTYRYEVAEDPDLTAALAAWATTSSVLAASKELGDATLELDARLSLRGGRSLRVRDVVASNSPAAVVAAAVGRPLALLLNNPLEKVTLDSAEVAVTIRHRLEVFRLEQVVVTTARPVAGGSLDLVATLRNYRGGAFERRLSLPLPAALPPGNYGLRVCDGAGHTAWDAKRAPGLYDPRSLDQVLDLLAREAPGNALVIVLVDSRPGVVAGGSELGRLPPSVMATLAAPGVSGGMGLTRGTVVARNDVILDGMVEGCEEMEITLFENPRGAARPAGGGR